MTALVCSGVVAGAAEQAVREAPMLVHQGDRIVIPEDSPLRTRLVVASAEAQANSHSVSTPAIVEADPSRTVNVLSPLTGRLVELRAGLGDTVKRGQVLAVISSPDLAQAQADVDKSADALDLARRALGRARGVKEVGANATKDLESAASAYNQALAEDERARTRLKTISGSGTADPRGRLLTVTAPVAGTVVNLNVGSGVFINDATAALMTIANLDRVWITAQVPENLVGSVGRGQAVDVRLTAYPNQLLHGTVRFVSPLLEPDTRRAKVRIEFVNPEGRLKPNMFATAVFAVPQSEGVVVPTSALLMNNDNTTVFLEVAPWTFERRTVELGAEDGEHVRIESGLKRGDRVVTRGAVLLND